MKIKVAALSGLLGFDQLTKLIFYDASVLNTGGIFGVAQGLWWELALLPGIFYLMYIWLREKNSRQSVGLTLLLAGGIGNIIDRFTRGGVVDFIHYPFFKLSGNIADIYLAIAVVSIFYFTLRPAHDITKP